jgi:F0F1-type ATP synthase assembly protein I
MNKDSKDKTDINWKKHIHFTSLGWELALPIVGGAFIGYQIDRQVGNGYSFTLILLFLGIITGYYSLYKYIELELLRLKIKNHKVNKEKAF